MSSKVDSVVICEYFQQWHTVGSLGQDTFAEEFPNLRYDSVWSGRQRFVQLLWQSEAFWKTTHSPACLRGRCIKNCWGRRQGKQRLRLPTMHSSQIPVFFEVNWKIHFSPFIFSQTNHILSQRTTVRTVKKTKQRENKKVWLHTYKVQQAKKWTNFSVTQD